MKIRLGTRGSRLAVVQATMVAEALAKHDCETEIVVIDSAGDIDTFTPLWRVNGVGIFTAALDTALLDGRIDVAVHSMKDVPTALPDGLHIAAVLPRASTHDVVVARSADVLTTLAEARYVVATSSRRRQAQWQRRYPHHQLVPLRGNVPTRLQRVADGDVDAIVLARAGLDRLGLRPEVAADLPWMIPAPAQGAICVVTRTTYTDITAILAHLNHEQTQTEVTIERKILAALDGGCSTAVGVRAFSSAMSIRVECIVLDPNGAHSADAHVVGSHADSVVADVVCRIVANGGRDYVEAWRHAE